MGQLLQPADYLDAAKEMLSTESEAFSRSAISRAYYACYHEALGVAGSLGYESPTHEVSAHRQLHSFLIRNNDKKTKEIGVRLQALHRKRVDADYKLQLSISVKNAKFAVMESMGVMGLCDIVRD